MVLRNDIEFLEVSLAAAACGANPVPINWHWREREITHVLRDSGARWYSLTRRTFPTWRPLSAASTVGAP